MLGPTESVERTELGLRKFQAFPFVHKFPLDIIQIQIMRPKTHAKDLCYILYYIVANGEQIQSSSAIQTLDSKGRCSTKRIAISLQLKRQIYRRPEGHLNFRF